MSNRKLKKHRYPFLLYHSIMIVCLIMCAFVYVIILEIHNIVCILMMTHMYYDK